LIIAWFPIRIPAEPAADGILPSLWRPGAVRIAAIVQTQTMPMLKIFLLVAAVAAAAYVVRRLTTPACPRCQAKRWDRKLCYPLLYCRSCATRVDSRLRLYN
jgi:hypothetical protein